MSIFNFLKSATVILVGGFVGYSSIKFFKPEEKKRFIASHAFAKVAKMGAEQNAHLLFDIKINTDELALTQDGISTIRVTVEAFKNINSGLTYNWKLPQDVELVEGPLTDILGEFSAQQSKEFTLKVKKFSKQAKKYLSFEVRGEFEQRPLRREVLISSRIEDSFEYTIQQNELNRLKNQHNKLGDEKVKSKFSPDRIVH